MLTFLVIKRPLLSAGKFFAQKQNCLFCFGNFRGKSSFVWTADKKQPEFHLFFTPKKK